jgi:hypothetical protein
MGNAIGKRRWKSALQNAMQQCHWKRLIPLQNSIENPDSKTTV